MLNLTLAFDFVSYPGNAGSGVPSQQDEVQYTLEEEIEYWKNQNQQQVRQ